MQLTIVSEWRLSTELITILTQLRNESFPEIDDLYHADPDELATLDGFDGRVLLLGRPPVTGNRYARKPQRWCPEPGIAVYSAPSVREILGTAGGLTKLAYAVALYLSGLEYAEDFHAEYTRVTADTDVWPPAGAELVVDIEISGDIDHDEPEDCDLLAVSLLWATAESGPRIVVFDSAALTDPHLVGVLRQCLVDSKGLTGHNGKFDFRWLNRLLDITVYPTDDTMLQHHAMFHGAGEHGLKQLAQRILGAPEWEVGIEQYLKRSKSHYERIPQDVLCQYNAQDVFWTWMLLQRFREMLAVRPDAQRAYDLEMEAARMFQDVEASGMPVDLDYASYLDLYFTDRYAAALPYFHEVAGQEINPNSPQQIKSWFAAQGISLGSTNKNTLTALVQSGQHQDFVAALITCRQIKKAHSTYVIGPLSNARNGWVHPTFKVHGTTTGRLSASSPNVQNVPNDDDNEEGLPSLRRMYSAPAGWTFIGADYSQAELRVIAELSEDAQMLHDLRDGAPDFFDNMLSSVWPEQDFAALSKVQRKPFRLKLKRIVYGLNYGRTAWAISAALTLEGTPTTEPEAQDIADAYLGRYPGLQRWRAGAMSGVVGGSWITPFGREFQQDVITAEGRRRIENQAWAFFPQSIASDICLTAAISLHRQLKLDRNQAHLACTVHDAIYALAPQEEAEQVRDLLVETMMAAAGKLYTNVPFPVDAHISRFWNEC